MRRNITQRTRDRNLAPDEAAKYRKVREQIEIEKPEINTRLKAQLEVTSSAQRVFQQPANVPKKKVADDGG